MIIFVDYASPSAFESTRDEASLAVAANARRPVRFHATVKEHGFIFRIAMRALGEAIWSNDLWLGQSEILDPVITVHPDRLCLEAFSQDQSAYAALIVDRSIFETDGIVATGTTNIDFSAWLWGALGEMRTSRRTMFRIGAEGVELTTSGAGGRFEKKVDLPDSWVRGFLQVQAAMALPGTRISVRPVDLLSAIRYLRYTKARVSPRALRYEFEPNQEARLVLEPWEHVVPLRDASHSYTERKVTRVWGRRRLKLIEGLLPFARSVDVYLKGRALPSFYAVKLPGMTFLLGLTGFSGSGFTGTGGFDLLSEATAEDDRHLEPALNALRRDYHRSASEIAKELGISEPAAVRVLVRLGRQGRCMFDVETRRYRHRELFEQPPDERKYFPPDLRRERAAAILQAGHATVQKCVAEETTKIRQLKTPEGRVTRQITYRDWRVTGVVSGFEPVEVVVNDQGQIIFGRCTCEFFNEHLLNQGPCEHLLALYQLSGPQRIEMPSSLPVAPGTGQATRKEPSRWEVDGAESTGDNDGSEEGA